MGPKRETNISFSEILKNLEKKFFVSTKNKSLYVCLKAGLQSPEERNFPLRQRIKINFDVIKEYNDFSFQW